MTDFADLAAEREAEIRADALAEHARRGGWPERLSAVLCGVCDEPIPEARRRAVPGVQTCIDCERELEQALNRTARRRPHGY